MDGVYPWQPCSTLLTGKQPTLWFIDRNAALAGTVPDQSRTLRHADQLPEEYPEDERTPRRLRGGAAGSAASAARCPLW